MFSLRNNKGRSSKLAACSALLLAIASSTALAGAPVGEGGEESGDDAPSKTQACSFIGCPNGSRVCGVASGKITSGAPPFVGEVAVSWTCYENPLQ